MSEVDFPLILLAALVGVASPGPSTLAIAGASLSSGRSGGLALAAGVTTGSLMWSAAAALGLSALMLANAWTFEAMRYAGAACLGFLAIRSARAALRPGAMEMRPLTAAGAGRAYAKGLALHLTNPKAIMFFGSLYVIGVPRGAAASDLALVFCAVGLQSALVFHGYALIFSAPAMAGAYRRLRRGFEGACAVFFGLAAFRIFTAKLT